MILVQCLVQLKKQKTYYNCSLVVFLLTLDIVSTDKDPIKCWHASSNSYCKDVWGDDNFRYETREKLQSKILWLVWYQSSQPQSSQVMLCFQQSQASFSESLWANVYHQLSSVTLTDMVKMHCCKSWKGHLPSACCLCCLVIFIVACNLITYGTLHILYWLLSSSGVYTY